MRELSYSETRDRYGDILDAVVHDHEAVTITRPGHEPAVIVSLADYQQLSGQQASGQPHPVADTNRMLDLMHDCGRHPGVLHDLIEG